MRSIPYVFFSYSMHDSYALDESISHSYHIDLFRRAHKQPVICRRNEHETQLISLRKSDFSGDPIITFDITRQITERKVYHYNEQKDELEESSESTSDYPRASCIVFPKISIMAVSDRSGEHTIQANSAVNRLNKIIQETTSHRLLWEFAASDEGIQRALEVWKIEKIDFTVKYFNPHPSSPGDLLSKLIKDNNAEVVGVVKGRNEYISDPEKGIVNEIVGLSGKGYGSFGARGVTDKGFRAQIVKDKDGGAPNSLRKMRVYVPERVDIEDHIGDVVDIMRRLYE